MHRPLPIRIIRENRVRSKIGEICEICVTYPIVSEGALLRHHSFYTSTFLSHHRL